MALNDAPNVRILNNTIANNITTATAMTSDGLPAPAGLSTIGHSAQLQATLPPGSDTFSNPELVNNIFDDNRAGTWAGAAGIIGIGRAGDSNPINLWDIANTNGYPDPEISFSMVDTLAGVDDGGSNILDDNPQFVLPKTTAVEVFTWRGFQRFRSAAIVSVDLAVSPVGDYHITSGSPARNAGTNTRVQFDIDGDLRPYEGAWEMGADEFVFGGAPGPLPPSTLLYFSTAGNSNPPNVTGSPDDADIYGWDGAAFSRLIDASGIGSLGLPGGANVDGFSRVDDTHFYMSFDGTVDPPGALGNVDDSDIVYYDAGTWSLFFDGSDVGLTTNGEDVDAFDILSDGSLVISTIDGGGVPGVSFNDEDLVRCGSFVSGSNTSCAWSMYFDGSDVGLNSGSEDVDGVAVLGGDIYLSTTGNFGVAGLSGQGADVFRCNAVTTGAATSCAGFDMYFDAGDNGFASGNQDIDAFDLPSSVLPPVLPFASPAGFARPTAFSSPGAVATMVVDAVSAAQYGPFTPVLDDFQRTDNRARRSNNTNINYGLNPKWWAGNTANSRVRIQNAVERVLRLVRNGTQTWVGDDAFGDAQEAYVTISRTSSAVSTTGVFLRATGLRPNGTFQRASSYVEVAYAPYLGGVMVRTKRAGQSRPDMRAVVPTAFGSGDTLLARMNVNGDLEVHRLPKGGTWELLDTIELGYGAKAWPTADTPHGGRIGINSTLRVRPGRLDNFGGGEIL